MEILHGRKEFNRKKKMAGMRWHRSKYLNFKNCMRAYYKLFLNAC